MMSLDPDPMPKLASTKCLPTYVVLDTSGSMQQHEALLNDTLKSLYRTMAGNPAISEFAHLSLISFNTEPHVVMPMTDIGKVKALPRLACGGLTNYGAVFDELYKQISADVPALVQTGLGVLRPAVFLLTDGVPSDDGWTERLASLRSEDWSYRPHIITYGFGGAQEEVLAKVASIAAFMALPGKPADQDIALTNAIGGLIKTLVASAKAKALLVPTQVEGFKSIPPEYMN